MTYLTKLIFKINKVLEFIRMKYRLYNINILPKNSIIIIIYIYKFTYSKNKING